MNVGFGELLVLAIIALVVFGPDKLPSVARSLGRALRAFQQETQRATSELRDAVEARPEPRDLPGVLDRPDDLPASPARGAPAPPSAVHHPAATRPAGDPATLEDT